MSDEKPVIGACVVPCPRCGQPVRVEVTAELSPIEKPGTHRLKITQAGEEIGQCWWRIEPLPIDHQCPRRAPLPLRRVA